MLGTLANMFGRKRSREEDSSPEATNSEEENVLSSPEPQDSASQEDNDAIDKEPEVSTVETNKATLTMAQLLTDIVPDADIHASKVIIVGGQSSGKTKMIISMVFHHLINNPAVTDDMGDVEIVSNGRKDGYSQTHYSLLREDPLRISVSDFAQL
jgi:hypothetical protein